MAKRVRLNAEILKLKKGQVFKGKFLGYGTKRCRDLGPDGEEQYDEKGELIMKDVRTLKFESDNGIPVMMFESGGLKSASDCFVEGKTYEIEGGEMKDIGNKKRCMEYAVYQAE